MPSRNLIPFEPIVDTATLSRAAGENQAFARTLVANWRALVRSDISAAFEALVLGARETAASHAANIRWISGGVGALGVERVAGAFQHACREGTIAEAIEALNVVDAEFVLSDRAFCLDHHLA